MKILVSTYTVQEIGGISTSLLNFINEIKNSNDVTLNVLSGYISPTISIPADVKLIFGSEYLKYGTISRNHLKKGLLNLILTTTARIVRRFLGNETFTNLAIAKLANNDSYDVAVAFSNDIYNTEGKLLIGGDYAYIDKFIKANIKLAWIHNDANKCGFTYSISKRIFKNYDGIIHVSEDNKKIFDEIIPEYQNKSRVIYNMYNLYRIRELSEAVNNPYHENGKLHFVTVSRLYEPQKRISRIISCCKRLKEDGYHNFDWTIVGDGEDRTMYERQTLELDLNSIINFVGLQTNPYPYMKHADAFVLSSIYEGLPMTIRESEILCTPILTTDFGSAHEAVYDGKQGLIGENSQEGLFVIIKKVLDDPSALLVFRKYLEDNPVNNNLALFQFYKACNKE